MMTVPGLAARHRALVRQLGFRILANDAHAAPSRRDSASSWISAAMMPAGNS
jgi:hypothetical protein